VLVGGGHTHVHVLRMLGADPLPGVRVTVLGPSPFATYSGMIPGTLAGLYRPEDARIDVAALAARADAAFLPEPVVRIDASRRVVETHTRGELAYDVLSLDVGSKPRGSAAVADYANVVPIKPIESAIERIDAFIDRAGRAACAPSAVVVGAGAGGVEVAFAIAARLAGVTATRVTLIDQAPEVLSGYPPKVRRLVARLLSRYSIVARLGARPVVASDDAVVLDDGERLVAPLVVWATGAEGLGVPVGSGLPLDERGFVRVDAGLRSVAYDNVFAAGDCAVLESHPTTPRAGVYAVRQGPILTHNLRVALTGKGRIASFAPQASFLSLLSTGDRRAVLSYRGVAAHGRIWWWLKDRIDRRFVARYAPPRPESLPRLERTSGAGLATMEPCGGCAAKVDARTLARALDRLPTTQAESVTIGLAARDDAAVLRHPAGTDIVATVDAFPPFMGDLFGVGEIAAVNAASDVYAMGGTPTAALALVSVVAGDAAQAEADLNQLLRGAASGLARLGIALAGGHSLASPATLIGFTVVGSLEAGKALTKGGARPGDVLVLTKGLGTAVILAATRAGECPAEWSEAALASMRTANRDAARVFCANGVRACTDVSGFALIGHLSEMLSAGSVAARVELERLPALPGARELLAAGWRSSADATIKQQLEDVELPHGLAVNDPRLALACDPQTSGGLLAAVPADTVGRVRMELAAAGVAAAEIGTIRDAPAGRLTLV
jgi:selenide,water dikinase